MSYLSSASNDIRIQILVSKVFIIVLIIQGIFVIKKIFDSVMHTICLGILKFGRNFPKRVNNLLVIYFYRLG